MNKTRKDLVLQLLKERLGQWVDGPDIANERVGGSEGLKRLRELRAEGYLIEKRSHPDHRRAVNQYRLRSPLNLTERKVAEVKRIEEQAAGQVQLFPDLKPQSPTEVFDE